MSVGRLAIVLHSHSPWLLGYGTWPVGEEWLRQAWAQSYIPVVALLRERAERGRTSMLTLGITPVLAAQWDQPASVTEQSRWIEDWRWRAIGKAIAATTKTDHQSGIDAARHYSLAHQTAAEFSAHWSAGGSAAVRPLADAGAIEILGGPMTHTFTPHLLEPIAHLAFESGLVDSTVRLGTRPRGVWLPECAYRPGVEHMLQNHGVTHTVVDGPTVQHVGASLHRPHRVSDSDVVVFARDLSLTYRVWSPRRGYPGSSWYQDFHSFDHEWGVRSSRVTRRSSPVKKPYEQDRAHQQVHKDARDFLDHARRVMVRSSETDPLVVVAYDTELFGHWWHEGPLFLSAVLDGAAEADIELTTLSRERDRALNAPGIDLPAGSWGSGKDFGVWEDGEAGALRDAGRALQYAVVDHMDRSAQDRDAERDSCIDGIATELLLGLASDWAFMVTKDSAVDYARDRARGHFAVVSELLQAHSRSNHTTHQPRDVRLPFVDARLARQELRSPS